MATLPSLDNMTPEEWVAAMQVLRGEVVEQAARILDTRTVPRLAGEPLQQVFDRYNNLDIGLIADNGDPGSQFSLEVRCKDDILIIWGYPSEEYESIVYTGYDYWWFDHAGADDGSRERHQLHRSVADQILEMLPWANQDDLLEIAAIEIASRAGE